MKKGESEEKSINKSVNASKNVLLYNQTLIKCTYIYIQLTGLTLRIGGVARSERASAPEKNCRLLKEYNSLDYWKLYTYLYFCPVDNLKSIHFPKNSSNTNNNQKVTRWCMLRPFNGTRCNITVARHPVTCLSRLKRGHHYVKTKDW